MEMATAIPVKAEQERGRWWPGREVDLQITLLQIVSQVIALQIFIGRSEEASLKNEQRPEERRKKSTVS